MTLRLVELRLTIAPKMEHNTPTETLSVKPADLPNTTALYIRTVDDGQIGSNAPWYADR
jgi:hypothetical protein